MKEESELIMTEYKNSQEFKDIIDNPVVETLLTISSIIPGANLAAITLRKFISNHEKKKMYDFLNCIANDNGVTMDDVKHYEVIMAFIKTLEAVNTLTRREKIIQYANMFSEFAKKEKRTDEDVDEYDELLNQFNQLSLREIELLHNLQKIEAENTLKNSTNDVVTYYEKSWDAFIEFYNKEYTYSDLVSIMSGISRTGFCVCDWSTKWNRDNSLVVYTTSRFLKLKDYIKLNK